MRASSIVTSNVSDPKRLRKTFKVWKACGTHLQLSVFECDLSAAEFVHLKRGLGEVNHHDKDQVLFVVLGPTASRGERLFVAMGMPYTKTDAACCVP